MTVQGWVADPSFSRSQGDMQYFYVNSRLVRDKYVNHAAKAAYADVMYAGRFPAFILYLTIDPEKVDVNVHPTKSEVRFQESRVVHDFIRQSIQTAITQITAQDHLQAADEQAALEKNTPPEETPPTRVTPPLENELPTQAKEPLVVFAYDTTDDDSPSSQTSNPALDKHVLPITQAHQTLQKDWTDGDLAQTTTQAQEKDVVPQREIQCHRDIGTETVPQKECHRDSATETVPQ